MSLSHQPTDSLVSWLADWQNIDCLTPWLADSLTDWVQSASYDFGVQNFGPPARDLHWAIENEPAFGPAPGAKVWQDTRVAGCLPSPRDSFFAAASETMKGPGHTEHEGMIFLRAPSFDIGTWNTSALTAMWPMFAKPGPYLRHFKTLTCQTLLFSLTWATCSGIARPFRKQSGHGHNSYWLTWAAPASLPAIRRPGLRDRSLKDVGFIYHCSFVSRISRGTAFQGVLSWIIGALRFSAAQTWTDSSAWRKQIETNIAKDRRMSRTYPCAENYKRAGASILVQTHEQRFVFQLMHQTETLDNASRPRLTSQYDWEAAMKDGDWSLLEKIHSHVRQIVENKRTRRWMRWSLRLGRSTCGLYGRFRLVLPEFRGRRLPSKVQRNASAWGSEGPGGFDGSISFGSCAGQCGDSSHQNLRREVSAAKDPHPFNKVVSPTVRTRARIRARTRARIRAWKRASATTTNNKRQTTNNKRPTTNNQQKQKQPQQQQRQNNKNIPALTPNRCKRVQCCSKTWKLART